MLKGVELAESSEVTSMTFKDTELTLAPPGHRESSVFSRAEKSSSSKAQVVGWPPVKSLRKKALESCKYVKVAIDGAPYLRKVDLETCRGYYDFMERLEELFTCFHIQRDAVEKGKLVDLVNGVKYVPTYEDKDGDWMLVGDVPWKMFIESCERIRLMRSSDAVGLAPETPTSSS